jgi:hypothetical protein
MKKILFIAICLTVLSCSKSSESSLEVATLLAKISTLEEQNKILKDSLESSEATFVYSQILIGISDKPVLKVGEKNNIAMLLLTQGRKLPKYDIYRIEDGKEIKVGENDGTRFDYEFIPKSIKDNSPQFLVKIPYNGRVIPIPGQVRLDVKN